MEKQRTLSDLRSQLEDAEAQQPRNEAKIAALVQEIASAESQERGAATRVRRQQEADALAARNAAAAKEQREIEDTENLAAEILRDLGGLNDTVDAVVTGYSALCEKANTLAAKCSVLGIQHGAYDIKNALEVAIVDRLLTKGFPVRRGTLYGKDEMPCVVNRAGYLLKSIPGAIKLARKQREAAE